MKDSLRKVKVVSSATVSWLEYVLFTYLHKVRCWIEAAHVADLCVTLGAGVVVGWFTGSYIKFSLTQGAANFGLLHLLQR